MTIPCPAGVIASWGDKCSNRLHSAGRKDLSRPQECVTTHLTCREGLRDCRLAVGIICSKSNIDKGLGEKIRRESACGVGTREIVCEVSFVLISFILLLEVLHIVLHIASYSLSTFLCSICSPFRFSQIQGWTEAVFPICMSVSLLLPSPVFVKWQLLCSRSSAGCFRFLSLFSHPTKPVMWD